MRIMTVQYHFTGRPVFRAERLIENDKGPGWLRVTDSGSADGTEIVFHLDRTEMPFEKLALMAINLTIAAGERPPTVSNAARVLVDYVNYRGDRALRVVTPTGEMFQSNGDFHPKGDWLVRVFDCDKQAVRDLAFSGIRAWGSVPEPAYDRIEGGFEVDVASGWKVGVRRGWARVGGAGFEVAPTTIDVVGYAPVSQPRWCAVVLNGSPPAISVVYGIEGGQEIPPVASGCLVVAKFRLHPGAKGFTDIEPVWNVDDEEIEF